MSRPTLGNPQNTIEILQKYQFTFQKKFGQNFTDTHVLDKLSVPLISAKTIWCSEIGPGTAR